MKNGEKEKSSPELFLERFIANGFSLEGTDDKEIMRYLLSVCSGKTAGSAEAEEILAEKLGSVSRLLFAIPSELCENGTMSESAVKRLKIISSMFALTELEKIGDMIPADDESRIKRYLSLLYMPHTCEVVYIIPIKGSRLGKPYMLSKGTDMSVNIDVEKIISVLGSSPSCKEFIISHSHPHDTSKPSEQDISATEQLFGYLYTCGYTLKAHYIAGVDGVSRVPFNDNPVRYFFS